MQITIHYADCCGNPKNTVYPYSSTAETEEEFAALVAKDHMFSAMRGGRRNNSNFAGASAICADIDNEHSDDPSCWIRPEDMTAVFPDTACVTYTSRNHLKQKEDRSPRPRFHVAFLISPVSAPEEYSALMKRLQSYLPCIDGNAADPARFFFGNPDAEVHFHNGNKTLDIFLDELDQLEEQEFAALTASHPSDPRSQPIPEGSRNSVMHGIAVRLLKRLGDTEESRATYQAAADRCSPPLPESELVTIWESALKYYNNVIRSQPDYIQPEQYGISPDSQWGRPIPLDPPGVPEFPVDKLPLPVANYVYAAAECIQAPLGMVSTCLLAILSVCIQGKYRIIAKPGWTEPLNLYTFVVLGPSERKSAVLNLLEKPLVQFERKYNLEHAAEFESSERRQSVLDKRKKLLEDKLVQGKASTEELDNAVKESQKHQVKKPLKLFSDNITMEKLCSVMKDNGDRAAIMSTEPGIFDVMNGTYSDNVNIDIFLKGYSGDRAIVERVGRADDRVEHPTLTVLLMGQPGTLESLMSNKKFQGRGLTSRFLYCLPDSIVGSRPYRTKDIPAEVQRAYETLVQNLLTDFYPDSQENTPVITLSPGAMDLHQKFYEEMESLQGTELKNYPPLKEWTGKLAGNVLRIAGILARAQADFSYPSMTDPFDDNPFREDDRDVFLQRSSGLAVDSLTMANAVAIGRCFLSHARKAFSLMGADQLTIESRYLRDVILDKGLREFSSREILRECRRFKTKAEILPVLLHLEDYGYIAPKETAYSGIGRPHAEVWLVNPLLFEPPLSVGSVPAGGSVRPDKQEETDQ